MSALTGARRKISSPSASESAFRIDAAAAADRRLADAARADRRFRIGNIQRGPLHVRPAHPESWAACCGGSAWRAASRSAGRKTHFWPIAWPMPSIERPRTWPPSARGWITVPTSATARKSRMWYLPVSTSTSTSAKPATIGMRLAVVRVVIAARPPADPGPASAVADAMVILLMSFRQFVAVVDAAEFDGALARPAPSVMPRAAAFAEDALVGDFVVLGLAAETLRGDLLQLLPGIHRRPRSAARVIAWVVWLPPETQVHGRFFAVLPQVISHFSQGTPRISAATRWTSLTDSVPRLPMPDWM